MKTHPHLLVRDRLAELFCEATRAHPDADADATLADLVRWSEGELVTPRLLALRVADGGALFGDGAALESRFASLLDWMRDRARRFGAARSWIRSDALEGNTLACACAAWDAGLFFEVHELLEPVWLEEKGPSRDTLQGLIMAGAALHHLCEGNRAGAQGLLHKAVERLKRAPDPSGRELGLELEPFTRALGELAQAVTAGRVRSAADIQELPRLEPAPPRAG